VGVVLAEDLELRDELLHELVLRGEGQIPREGLSRRRVNTTSPAASRYPPDHHFPPGLSHLIRLRPQRASHVKTTVVMGPIAPGLSQKALKGHPGSWFPSQKL